jgi:formamidopyrimidine-DNA glycosylase
VEAVERRAKIQLVHLSGGLLLEVHFRMTGDWDFGRHDEPRQPLERARIALDDGSRVSFIDGRAFGILRLHAEGAFALPALGPEPLEEAFTAAVLREALALRRGPIKPVLLDQRVVAGLGNIYAAEALWEARIHPECAANSLSRARVARLRDAIRLVLREAPVGRYYARANDGESVGDSDADTLAVAQENWRVYGREGEPCRRCAGRVARIVQAGRSTFLCRRCQR